MQKWKIIKELDTDYNPVCFDLGNIEEILPDENSQRWQGVPYAETIIADGKEYYLCGDKKIVHFTMGCIPMMIKSGTGCKEFDKEPGENEFLDLEDYKGVRVGNYCFDSPGCSDPRILYLLDKRLEYYHSEKKEKDAEHEVYLHSKMYEAVESGNNKEKSRLERELDKHCRKVWENFISNIPSIEDALQWLNERGYQSTPVKCNSDIEQKNYRKLINNEYKYIRHRR